MVAILPALTSSSRRLIELRFRSARLAALDKLHEAAKKAVRIHVRYDLVNLQTLGEEALESVGRFSSGTKEGHRLWAKLCFVAYCRLKEYDKYAVRIKPRLNQMNLN